MAEVKPHCIAIATMALSIMGRMFLGMPFGNVAQTAGSFKTHILAHSYELKNGHLLVLHTLYNKEEGVEPHILSL
jgi:hypothetical protein